MTSGSSMADVTTLSPTEQSHSLAQHYINIPASESWSVVAGYVLLGLVATVVLVLVVLVLARSSPTSSFFPRRDVESGRVWWGGGRGLDAQAAVMISHSLPDLSRSVSQELLLPCDNKKVPRQTTLPTVPQRHASFQRQLSQRLHLDPVQFSVCHLERKDDLGHLKVSGKGEGASGEWKGSAARTRRQPDTRTAEAEK
ncbi:hypothetical protein O3P69_014115 [Scylla paramamosain]|uniref:Uncharacterized protein n=1 Tax=Scylla paramamosain TaxID=85552 RepID=A0AAW0SRJ6_SCYPA